MNETTKLKALLLSMCKVLYFLFPIPVAWLSLSLMSIYMKYYDIGVNSGANNGFLVFIVGPVLLIVLFITAAISLYLANRFHKSLWLGILIGSVLVFIIGIGAFIIQTQSYSDYPTEKPQNMSLFLKYYVREMGGMR